MRSAGPGRNGSHQEWTGTALASAAEAVALSTRGPTGCFAKRGPNFVGPAWPDGQFNQRWYEKGCMEVPPPDQGPDEPAGLRLFSNPDLLFLITAFAELPAIASLTKVSKDWRAAALRADLPHWKCCSVEAFNLLSDRQEPPWDTDTIGSLLLTKPRVEHLDLTGATTSSIVAVRAMAKALPPTLHTLTLRSRTSITHPDAMLDALLARGVELPQLRSLDLQAVLSERSLMGLRLQLQLRRRRESAVPNRGPAAADVHAAVAAPPHAATGATDGTAADADAGMRLSFARALPALEVLSVGFHLFTAVGHHEGVDYLHEQQRLAPSLRRIGCLVDSTRCGPLDVHCRLCGTAFYKNLTEYIVHPPQQQHISYELHTNVAPIAAATHAVDGDDTRLQCARRCHERLWLVDAGSGYVTHLVDKRFAIACGPATTRSGQQQYPGLAVAVPAAPVGAESAADEPHAGGEWQDAFPKFERLRPS